MGERERGGGERGRTGGERRRRRSDFKSGQREAHTWCLRHVPEPHQPTRVSGCSATAPPSASVPCELQLGAAPDHTCVGVGACHMWPVTCRFTCWTGSSWCSEGGPARHCSGTVAALQGGGGTRGRGSRGRGSWVLQLRRSHATRREADAVYYVGSCSQSSSHARHMWSDGYMGDGKAVYLESSASESTSKQLVATRWFLEYQM